MTQKQLAEKLNLTEQAISKWERGIGLPDIGTLAEILGVNIEVILKEVNNNMKNLNYYICPVCENFIVSTAEVTISCCGRPVQLSVIQKATEQEKMNVTIVEDQYYITCDHPMTKDDYISFTAFATGEKLEVIKHYPEYLGFSMPNLRHGKLIWYSQKAGLKYQLL